MDLVFNKQGNEWVAEFEATADFNLHIEREMSGLVKVYQRTAGGKYTPIKELSLQLGSQLTIDYDFVGVVWPKYIKVVSKVEPTLAVVTFAAASGEDGEAEPVEDDIFYFYDGTGWSTTCNIVTQEVTAEGDVIFNPDDPLECATLYGQRGNSPTIAITPANGKVTTYDSSDTIVSEIEVLEAGTIDVSGFPTYIVVENYTTGRTYKIWMGTYNAPW